MNKEALYYQSLDFHTVRCSLCPHRCVLHDGKVGVCRVRHNEKGELKTDVYGFVSAIHFDPIEKKPLYHFYPGSVILSIGSYGCNLRCRFCQNYSISQSAVAPDFAGTIISPEQIIEKALSNPKNMGIAFTYNEPTVWIEYMLDIARLAKSAGIKTVMVSNGFINEEPLIALLGCIDAFSIDIKAFTEDFYRKTTSSQLEPVKETLKRISRSGKHLELVNLLIPGNNDLEPDFVAMVKWVAAELGRDTVFHISRYFPTYRMTTEATQVDVIKKFQLIAAKELSYVYTGNIPGESNDTFCKWCNTLLITRNYCQTDISGLTSDGRCRHCGNLFLKKI